MTAFSVKVCDFSLSETLSCGQCFRWNALEQNVYVGVAYDRKIKITQVNDLLSFEGINENDYNQWFCSYLSLDEDYSNYKKQLSQDKTLSVAIKYAQGIRVMKQQLWEALCSFIISQNNNIPRISGIIGRFCEGFGVAHDDFFEFPTADAISNLSVDDLAPIRSGFRAKYIIDAAKKFRDSEIDEAFIKTAPLDDARNMLMTIKGVGPKVADCALLFGAARYDAFPIDVWMKKAMAQLFPDGLPECAKKNAGIAQQYIFHYARTSGLLK